MGFENLNLGDEIFVHGHRGKCAIPRGLLYTGTRVSPTAPRTKSEESPHSGGRSPPLTMKGENPDGCTPEEGIPERD